MGDLLIYGAIGLGTFLLAKPKAHASTKVSDDGATQTKSDPFDAARAELLRVTAAEEALNVRELGSSNSDRSPRIDTYNRSVNLSAGSLWCAAFVSWCVMTALGRGRPPKWAGSQTSWIMVAARDAFRSGKLPAQYVAFGNDINTWNRVKAGWVWVKGATANGSDALNAPRGGWKRGHTGIVREPISVVKQGHFSTTEGNTMVRYGPREFLGHGGVYNAERPWVGNDNVIWFDPMALTYYLENEQSKPVS